MLDLACGSGEMLCTWARDHRLTGTGVDISTAFIGAARARAIELDVADRVTFIHGDAAGYVAERPVGVASCMGTTWIGDGVAGTVELLRRSLSPGGIMLVGEPYWRREPPDQATLEGCYGIGEEDWLPLPELIESFGLLGCDVVEMAAGYDQDIGTVTPQRNACSASAAGSTPILMTNWRAEIAPRNSEHLVRRLRLSPGTGASTSAGSSSP